MRGEIAALSDAGWFTAASRDRKKKRKKKKKKKKKQPRRLRVLLCPPQGKTGNRLRLRMKEKAAASPHSKEHHVNVIGIHGVEADGRTVLRLAGAGVVVATSLGQCRACKAGSGLGRTSSGPLPPKRIGEVWLCCPEEWRDAEMVEPLAGAMAAGPLPAFEEISGFGREWTAK